MPKETFLNLSEEKRRRFIEAALREFSQHNFENASINRIIKNLSIARGSVYQYFNDKLDLWLYLKSYAEQTKMKYILDVQRADFPSFWEYYEAMYTHGIDFDLEEPLCSQFLYRIGFKENSEQVLSYLDDWKKQATEVFTQWVNAEKEQGSFNPELPTDTVVHFLITMSMSIAELLKSKYNVDFDQNLKANKSLYGNNKMELEKAVKELIQLLKKALT